MHTESTPTGSACLRACVVTGFQLNPAGINKSLYQAMAISVSL
ncbi:hypothetical protein BN133_1100 [Cronobacter dublinensis 582]|nr:hypothetical protein BN133_1100 [Cronobacter dublinensis 582]